MNHAAPQTHRISADTADRLYVEILHRILVEKYYRHPNYTEGQLAQDIKTNTRYIALVLQQHTGQSYTQLVNKYRLRDACRMLHDKKYADFTAEEIGIECGFSSRQAFYIAFGRTLGMTPRQYRQQITTA